MALTNPDNFVTEQRLKEFYDLIYPNLVGSAATGFTPIGTIIAVMGTTPPNHYLACDGSVYNISEYPELAGYFAGQFGSTNFFGGNGTSTFAVPDLRESSLVGSGQSELTEIVAHDVFTPGQFKDDCIQDHSHSALAANNDVNNANSQGYPANNNHISFRTTDREGVTTNIVRDLKGAKTLSGFGTPRTDTVTRSKSTGVLYCIATKNIYIDVKNTYSLDEMVIGTWVDGKPLYRKTFSVNFTVSSGLSWVSSGIKFSDYNIDSVIKFVGKGQTADYSKGTFYPQYTKIQSDYLYVYSSGSVIVDKVTLEYTKTTDQPIV